MWDSSIHALFFLICHNSAEEGEEDLEKEKLLYNGVFIFYSLCECIVNFLAFLSSFTKNVFFPSHVLTLIVNLNNRTNGWRKKNASNLVNWVKCFECGVLCYHKIGIYWEIGNYVECEALSIPSYHVKSRRSFQICVHCYREHQ